VVEILTAFDDETKAGNAAGPTALASWPASVGPARGRGPRRRYGSRHERRAI